MATLGGCEFGELGVSFTHPTLLPLRCKSRGGRQVCGKLRTGQRPRDTRGQVVTTSGLQQLGDVMQIGARDSKIPCRPVREPELNGLFVPPVGQRGRGALVSRVAVNESVHDRYDAGLGFAGFAAGAPGTQK